MSRYLFIENKSTYVKARQGSADPPHKDANLHLAKKCDAGFQKAAQNPEQSNQAVFWLPRTKWTHLRLDRALLMRHKDANLRLTKKCGAGFHKATKYQPDLMRHKAAILHLTQHLRLDRAQLMRHKDANLHLTKRCGTGFQKAAQNSEQSNQAGVTAYLFMENNMQI